MTSQSSGHPSACVGMLQSPLLLLSGVRNSLYLRFASLYWQLSLSLDSWLDWKRLETTQTGALTLLGVRLISVPWGLAESGDVQLGWLPQARLLQAPSAPHPAGKHWHCHLCPQLALRPEAVRTQRCIYSHILFRHQGQREDMLGRKKGEGELSHPSTPRAAGILHRKIQPVVLAFCAFLQALQQLQTGKTSCIFR